MHIKILAVATLTVMWTGHALADCAADLDKMKDAVTSAETGAASTASGMPETKHQKEVCLERRLITPRPIRREPRAQKFKQQHPIKRKSWATSKRHRTILRRS